MSLFSGRYLPFEAIQRIRHLNAYTGTYLADGSCGQDEELDMKWDSLEEQNCSLSRTVAVIGDRWTLLVLRELG